ncbi:unnamed protein product [Lactuca virosa]|uniref:Uncharacterized protein n=1 Tax=Lactuca virosa TaxID=75947 RepID=A0AAU9N5A6_9ASTR|nr:unnamed protein product [Lactuca virosa]
MCGSWRVRFSWNRKSKRPDLELLDATHQMFKELNKEVQRESGIAVCDDEVKNIHCTSSYCNRTHAFFIDRTCNSITEPPLSGTSGLDFLSINLISSDEVAYLKIKLYNTNEMATPFSLSHTHINGYNQSKE